MKIRRIGYTEGSLLFIYWLTMNNDKLTHADYVKLQFGQRQMLNWLHSTSGFYDKRNPGSYFDLDFAHYDFAVLRQYLQEIQQSLADADHLAMCIHETIHFVPECKQTFLDSFRCRTTPTKTISRELVFASLANKKVLLVSSFARLMKQQHDCGNLQTIYADYPSSSIQSVLAYTTPYTFFNSGPDQNMIETCERVFRDIEARKDDFDVAVISFGAYSNLLAHWIDTRLQKQTITLGEEMQFYFGILSQRRKEKMAKAEEEAVAENEHLYITHIPEEYKPKNYHKIENGCYW